MAHLFPREVVRETQNSGMSGSVSLRDRLLASDPPLERLRLSTRATLGVVLAGLPLLELMKLGVLPGPSAVLGTALAALASLQANDPKPAARNLTGALIPFSGSLGATLAALLTSVNPSLGAAGFLAVAFPAIWVRKYGPRGLGLGMSALLMYFFALFVQLKLPQLGPTVLAIFIGGAVAWIVHFVLLPDSQHVALRSALTAFRAQLRLVGEAIQFARTADGDAGDKRMREETFALNAAALSLDKLIAGDAFVLDGAAREAMRAAILEAELLAERGTVVILETSFVPEAQRLVTESIESALAARANPGADAPMSAAPTPPDIGGPSPATRQALQITLASAAAMLVGAAIPPHQYAWALLTAFIVYNRTASTAEAFRRVVARVVGTAIGVGLGIALVGPLKGEPAVEVGLALVGIFVATYAFRSSYFVFTLCITVAIASVYNLAGRPTDELLVARLIETTVGALCGALVASFVLPLRTSAVLAVTGKGFAQKLRAAVDEASVAAARELDASLQEFLGRARPLLSARTANAPREAIAAVWTCTYRTRELALRAQPLGAVRPSADAAAEALEDTFGSGWERFDDATWDAAIGELNTVASALGRPTARAS